MWVFHIATRKGKALLKEKKKKIVVANLQKLANVPGGSCRTLKHFYYILFHLKLLIPLVIHNQVTRTLIMKTSLVNYIIFINDKASELRS